MNFAKCGAMAKLKIMFNKINLILDSELKKIIPVFFISITVVSLLEIFSLSLIIPLITLILNDLVIQFIYNNLPFLKDYSNSAVVIMLFLLGLVTFLKQFFIFFSWLQFSYVAK